MKTLFEFTLPKMVESEEIEITKDEKDNEVKTIKIVEKEIAVKVAIKKPTRELTDAGKLFYAVKSSEAHQAGVISEMLLQKRIANDGGSLNESEKKEFGDLYLTLFQKQQSFYELDSKSFDELTEEQKENKKKLATEIGELSQRVSIFQANHSQIFENTVEAYARNHSMRFWILQLSYVEKIDDKGVPKGEFLPLFGVGDYNQKLKVYDDLEEKDDAFYLKAIRKLANLISYWYINQAQSAEDFKKLSDAYDNEMKANEVQSA